MSKHTMNSLNITCAYATTTWLMHCNCMCICWSVSCIPTDSGGGRHFCFGGLAAKKFYAVYVMSSAQEAFSWHFG